MIVTAGAKQAVFNVCQALFEEGADVALFSPYWVSFPEMVRLTGATPLFVPTTLAQGWRPTADALARHASAAVRGVILNSPNNPTGAVVSPEELDRILDWCEARDAWLIYDETYDRFVYDGRPHASAAARLARRGRIVVTGAASKTYAMTGWRLGWAFGPPELIRAMTSYQSHTTSNASSISQAAALAALTELDTASASVSEMLSHYQARRAVMVEGLSAIRGVHCAMPEGAFYAFADVSALYPRRGVRGSVEFCERLLAEAHVAAVPGDAFGDDACVRFSYASPTARIREGLRRLTEWATPEPTRCGRPEIRSATRARPGPRLRKAQNDPHVATRADARSQSTANWTAKRTAVAGGETARKESRRRAGLPKGSAKRPKPRPPRMEV